MPERFQAKHGGGYHQGYGYGYGGGGGQYQQQYQQQQGYQGGNTYPQMNYQQGGGGGGGGGGQYQGGGGGGQQDPNAEIEAEVKKYLPQVLRMCQKQCCTVM